MAVVMVHQLSHYKALSVVLQITINRPEKRNAFTPRTGDWDMQLCTLQQQLA